MILVVEDEFLLRMDLEASVEDAGYDVVSAPTADSAMQILEHNNDIELVITDINMPGKMDGVDLATATQKLHRDIKVIFLSGHVRGADFARLLNVPFFQKPCDFSRIHSKMRELLHS